MATKSITKLVADALKKESEQDLNEEQLNLLRLCRLLVKIEYRHKYSNTPGDMDQNEV